jgi:hypothetical protein
MQTQQIESVYQQLLARKMELEKAKYYGTPQKKPVLSNFGEK